MAATASEGVAIEDGPARTRQARTASALWSLVAVGVGALALPLDPNLLEEGIVVHIAERMANGEALFRDIVIHTGLLPFELLAAMFRLFGPDIGLARVALLPLQGLACGAVYQLVASTGDRGRAHCAAAAVASAPILLFPFLSIVFYTTLAFYLSLIAAYAAHRAVDSGSTGWAFGTGLLIAAVALSKQSNGAILAITLAPATVFACRSERRRSVATALCSAGLVAVLATLALYGARGDLGPMWFAQVELPLAVAGMEGFRAPYPNLWPPGEMSAAVRENWVMYLPNFYFLRHGLFTEIGPGIVIATQFLFALPFVAALLSLARGIFGRAPYQLWLHGSVIVAMTSNLWPRADWGHLSVALPPAIIQLLLCLPTDLARSRVRLRNALAMIAVGFVGLSVLWTAHWLWEQSGPATLGPRVPFRTVSRVYRDPTIPRVISYIRANTQPGDPIFVARCEPLIYYATHTRNPTPFEGIFPGMPAMQESAILEALPSLRYVVMSDVDSPFYTYYSDELPRVHQAFERYFRVPSDFPTDDYSWLVVLERVGDQGENLIDLVDGIRPMYWVRDRESAEVTTSGSTAKRLAARQNHRPLAVTLGPLGGGVDYTLVVPERAAFRAGVGYRRIQGKGAVHEHPTGLTLTVEINDGDGLETLAEIDIDDDLRAGRRWTPVHVDLARYAGRRVLLRLAARADSTLEPSSLTWWGSPRIVRLPESR